MAIRGSISGEPKNLGERIARAREDRRMTASDLARRMQVTPTAVWNWEKNGIVPRPITLAAIATLLKVSESYLRHGAASGPKTNSQTGSTAPVHSSTIADIIDQSRRDIAAVAGLPLERVRINVEFS